MTNFQIIYAKLSELIIVVNQESHTLKSVEAKQAFDQMRYLISDNLNEWLYTAEKAEKWLNEDSVIVLQILFLLGLIGLNIHLSLKERGERRHAMELEKQSRTLESQQQTT